MHALELGFASARTGGKFLGRTGEVSRKRGPLPLLLLVRNSSACSADGAPGKPFLKRRTEIMIRIIPSRRPFLKYAALLFVAALLCLSLVAVRRSTRGATQRINQTQREEKENETGE